MKAQKLSRLFFTLTGLDAATTRSTRAVRHHESHREWVMELIRRLIGDQRSRQTISMERGKMLVMSPYKRTLLEEREHPPPPGRIGKSKATWASEAVIRTVEARTVDTAQGYEADVCILDSVQSKCTLHSEDANWLCYPLTRARQADFIIMHLQMSNDDQHDGILQGE